MKVPRLVMDALRMHTAAMCKHKYKQVQVQQIVQMYTRSQSAVYLFIIALNGHASRRITLLITLTESSQAVLLVIAHNHSSTQAPTTASAAR